MSSKRNGAWRGGREPQNPFTARQVEMGIATVYLVGIDDLRRVPDFLELGAVVVIAPDRSTLRRWQQEEEAGESRPPQEPEEGALVIDLSSRQVLCGGRRVALTDLEFRVLASLMSRPGVARSFRELRRAGWGEGPDFPFDIYPVRSLIQRLRVKLNAAEAPIRIEAIRGFGFRVESGAGDGARLGAVASGRSA